jgi:hypothetical protein
VLSEGETEICHYHLDEAALVGRFGRRADAPLQGSLCL